ncbi:hypothetical protein [Bradyrhizobium sp. BR 1432]|uniref:hypothetical protein n=1 Tax=Bradyrhizobium sp. BR 1432 TaxID=3447966 RepID=UPI003EE7D035
MKKLLAETMLDNSMLTTVVQKMWRAAEHEAVARLLCDRCPDIRRPVNCGNLGCSRTQQPSEHQAQTCD